MIRYCSYLQIGKVRHPEALLRATYVMEEDFNLCSAGYPFAMYRKDL